MSDICLGRAGSELKSRSLARHDHFVIRSRYKWACYDYNNPKLLCFDKPIGDVMNTESPIITIPGKELTTNTTAFMFNLTVTKGERVAYSIQVVEMKRTAVIE